MALASSDFIAAWGARLQAAADAHPAVPFEGRTALPAWLAKSAREQAERVFLVLDGTPIEKRDLGWAEGFVRDSGMAFLSAWASTMEAFGTHAEGWAKDAADAAVEAYHGRLNELAPGLHAGGSA